MQGLAAALQSLYLKHFIVQPSQLRGLTQVTSMHLIDVRLEPTELLALLGKLTKLQQLHVTQGSHAMGEEEEEENETREAEHVCPAASAKYASLTASSQLQELSLANCQLPPGMWPHVFPAGRQLTQLRSLYAVCKHSAAEESLGKGVPVGAGQRTAPEALAGGNLA